MDNDEKVLQLVKTKGPLLPIHIVKEIGGDTILIGAILSTLSEKGLIKVSCAKIGGSPLYYTPGQEPKLDVLCKYLHEKEQKAYNLLKEKKVLRDIALEPIMRVSLRAIKDFAKPLEVDINDKSEIFWKWHLATNAEAEPLIREQLKLSKETKEIRSEREIKKTEKKEKKAEEEVLEEKPKEEKEMKDQPAEKESTREKRKEKGAFLEILNAYFKDNNIEILEKISAKAKEADFLIKVPSAIGFSTFYCKAKDKKTINEGDLSTAYVQGEMKKLPVLFLTTGELAKKAKEMFGKEFKNFIVKKINN